MRKIFACLLFLAFSFQADAQNFWPPANYNIGPSGGQVSVIAVNFNSANSDTTIPIVYPSGYTRFEVLALSISHASGSISVATAGLFTASGGAGTAIAATQALTVTTASENTASNAMALNITNSQTTTFNLTQLFFRVTIAQGAAATADVTVTLRYLP